MNGYTNPLPAKLSQMADVLAPEHALLRDILKEAALEIGVLEITAQAATDMALAASRSAVEQRTLKEGLQRRNTALVLENRRLRGDA